jgi:hypothetical protein
LAGTVRRPPNAGSRAYSSGTGSPAVARSPLTARSPPQPRGRSGPHRAESLVTLGEIQTDLGDRERARELLSAAPDQLTGVASVFGRARHGRLGAAEQLDG